MFNFFKKKAPAYSKEDAVIVDVRSPGEYSSGHVTGSINIPVEEMTRRAGELDPGKTILLCCASGSRSGVATLILKAKGFKNVFNAGPWGSLK